MSLDHLKDPQKFVLSLFVRCMVGVLMGVAWQGQVDQPLTQSAVFPVQGALFMVCLNAAMDTIFQVRGFRFGGRAAASARAKGPRAVCCAKDGPTRRGPRLGRRRRALGSSSLLPAASRVTTSPARDGDDQAEERRDAGPSAQRGGEEGHLRANENQRGGGTTSHFWPVSESHRLACVSFRLE